MIPWLIFGLVAVPLLIVAFVAARRRTDAYEHPTSEGAQASNALTDQELEDAEAYQEKLAQEDRARYYQEDLP